MLEKIEIKRIRDVARERGSELLSFYAEQREERTIEFQGRQQRARVQNEEYSKLGLEKENILQELHIEDVTTEGILKAMGTEASSRSTREYVKGDHFQNLPQKRNTLELLIKKAALDLDVTPSARVKYTESRKSFLVAREETSEVLGKENIASLEAEFIHQGRKFSVAKYSRSLDDFWKSLEGENNPLEPKFLKGWENPWPAPEGKLPVHWSSLSVSKLLLPFLKVFEAKRVENQKSLLCQWKEALPLRFDLSDKPDTTLSAYDSRGVLKPTLSLIERGQPVNLLDAKSSGFWNVHLKSEYQKDSLLKELNMGVSVNDLQVNAFDPASGQIVLTLLDSCLLHHGERGECILPVTLQCSLLDLFQSWQYFSKEASPFGYWSSRFLTELNVPEAMSNEFLIPGTVSKSHYW